MAMARQHSLVNDPSLPAAYVPGAYKLPYAPFLDPSADVPSSEFLGHSATHNHPLLQRLLTGPNSIPHNQLHTSSNVATLTRQVSLPATLDSMREPHVPALPQKLGGSPLLLSNTSTLASLDRYLGTLPDVQHPPSLGHLRSMHARDQDDLLLNHPDAAAAQSWPLQPGQRYGSTRGATMASVGAGSPASSHTMFEPAASRLARSRSTPLQDYLHPPFSVVWSGRQPMDNVFMGPSIAPGSTDVTCHKEHMSALSRLSRRQSAHSGDDVPCRDQTEKASFPAAVRSSLRGGSSWTIGAVHPWLPPGGTRPSAGSAIRDAHRPFVLEHSPLTTFDWLVNDDAHSTSSSSSGSSESGTLPQFSSFLPCSATSNSLHNATDMWTLSSTHLASSSFPSSSMSRANNSTSSQPAARPSVSGSVWDAAARGPSIMPARAHGSDRTDGREDAGRHASSYPQYMFPPWLSAPSSTALPPRLSSNASLPSHSVAPSFRPSAPSSHTAEAASRKPGGPAAWRAQPAAASGTTSRLQQPVAQPHHARYSPPLMRAPSKFQDLSCPLALELANELLAGMKLPGKFEYIPVSDNSPLYRLGVLHQFTAFDVALGSTYYQRLMWSFAHSTTLMDMLVGSALGSVSRFTNSRKFARQEHLSQLTRKQACYSVLQFVSLLLAAKVLGSRTDLSCEVLRVHISGAYQMSVSLDKAVDVEVLCLQKLHWRLGPYLEEDQLQWLKNMDGLM